MLRKSVFALLAVLALCGGFFAWKHITGYATCQRLDGQSPICFELEIVSEPAERIMGLSNRERLEMHQGMLFVFDDDDRHGIWMKDMRFDLDIVWLDNQKRITHIEQSVSPDTYPFVYLPPIPSRYVLEVPSGTVALTHWRIGDALAFRE